MDLKERLEIARGKFADVLNNVKQLPPKAEVPVTKDIVDQLNLLGTAITINDELLQRATSLPVTPDTHYEAQKIWEARRVYNEYLAGDYFSITPAPEMRVEEPMGYEPSLEREQLESMEQVCRVAIKAISKGWFR